MTQERPRVRMEKKQYFDRNIWDMSIDLTYFVMDIFKVGISRWTYYISFERMCLTDSRDYSSIRSTPVTSVTGKVKMVSFSLFFRCFPP